MAKTVAITLKDKDGNQVSTHEITVETQIPEVFVEAGVFYILRRVTNGAASGVATQPASVYDFDAEAPMQSASLKFVTTE